MPEPERQSTGVVMAVGAAAFFGTLAIFAKLAYRDGADPIILLGVRFSIAAALMLGLHAVTGRSLLVERRKLVALLLLGGAGYAVESSLFFLALDRAPAAIAELIFFSYPLWVNLMGLATGLERFRPRVLVALMLASAGVVLIFSVHGGSVAGRVLALVAAVAVAVYFLCAQVIMRGVPASVGATWTATGAAVSLTVTGVVLRQSLPAAALPHAAALGLATALAFFGLYGAIKRLGSARTSIVTMLEPVTTVFLAALVLGEDLTPRVLAGAALVLAALPVLLRSTPEAALPPEAPA